MFKTILQVFDKKASPKEADINKIPPYIFCKWLGQHYKTISTANELNLYSKIPVLNQYSVVRNKFLGQRLFIKYPKNTKDDSCDNEIFARYWNININMVPEYKSFLSEDEQNKIINMYKGIK